MRFLRIGTLVVGLVFLGGATATAHSMTSPDGGAKAYDSNSGRTMNVSDIKCDGEWVYGYWNNTGNRLNNKSGCNTSANKGTSSTITAVQACTQYDLAPDSCSNWG